MHLQKLDKLLEVHIFMKRKKERKTIYSLEYKISVIMDMRENHLRYRETVRKYGHTKTRVEEDNHRSQVKNWDCISRKLKGMSPVQYRTHSQVF